MKKTTLSAYWLIAPFLSLYWLIAALVILGLGACSSTPAGNKNHIKAPDYRATRLCVDWNGPYTGTVFSTSGRTIDALLYLKSNDTFELSYSYEDKPDRTIFTIGKFKWDKTETNIILEVRDFPPYYRVASHKLIPLDSKGKIITNDNVESYGLKKMECNSASCNS